MHRTFYADVTINDKNIVKRNLQILRYKHALLSVKNLPLSFSGSILDYGGGNGELCKYISVMFPNAKITMYEPSTDLKEEATFNLEKYQKVKILDNLNNIIFPKFNIIFCLAVFEHIPEDRYVVLLKDFYKLLSKNGRLVIGIPVEVYIPALLKGIFRMSRRYGEYDANIKNILRCVIGKPPKDRPISQIDVSIPYYYHHLGFDNQIFQIELLKYFKIIKIYGSPFPFLFAGCNFEKYYLCKK